MAQFKPCRQIFEPLVEFMPNFGDFPLNLFVCEVVVSAQPDGTVVDFCELNASL